MDKRVTVLGVGLVGGYIARTLAGRGLSVRAIDISHNALESLQNRCQADALKLEVRTADLSDPSTLYACIQDADVVVGAVTGGLGYRIVKTVIEIGKPMVDISFMPEDPMILDAMAKKQGVPVVVDCGLAPGLNNLFVGYAASKVKFDTGAMYVGGLPKIRNWPYEYQMVFSARDVIEEYTRPARTLVAGQVVTQEALSDVELIQIEGVGTLEAFNSDGLRTLLQNSPIPTFKEKTLRYPGHAEKMLALRTAGFFDTTPVCVGEQEVSPVDVTCEILKRAWQPRGEGHDQVVMEIFLDGRLGKARFSLRDQYSTQEQVSAMARTTGLPCVAMVGLLLTQPRLLKPGVYAPEHLATEPVAKNIKGNETIFHHMLRTLQDHGVSIHYQLMDEST